MRAVLPLGGGLRRLSATAAPLLVIGLLAGCGSSAKSSGSAATSAAGSGSAAASSTTGGSSSTESSSPIVAVGAENEYANVISQIGGPYVKASAIMSNPNTDPHTFEASPSVAQTVSQAKLIVQNGVGYDDFMDKIESASPSSSRKVIDVQKIRGLPDNTPNPHLWYDLRTMPALAKALVTDLSALDPAHASYFKASAAKFDASLKPWYDAIAQFKKQYPHVPVATTEPVADYMLQAAGADNMTPFSLQASIMNGTDPAPQNVSLQNSLFSSHKVKVFVYNQQVTDTITQNFLKLAAKNKIPVVGVYETMPTPGYTYQSWMMAEISALRKAVANGTSTTKLGS
jgi:zinc/manganese transport system substrate-binding protein